MEDELKNILEKLVEDRKKHKTKAFKPYGSVGILNSGSQGIIPMNYDFTTLYPTIQKTYPDLDEKLIAERKRIEREKKLKRILKMN